VSPVSPKKRKKDDDFAMGWVTISYRSVWLSILAVVALIGVGFYFAFPDTSRKIADSVGGGLSSLFAKMGLSTSPKTNEAKNVGDQKASFTMIDGTVKVRKKNSNSFVNAGYDTPLEKGDVVQTSSEGMAKIVFADQTSYTVRQDSLIVIEDNSTNTDQQTSVAVRVTTGTVDLSTATYQQGSKSQVIVADAKADISPETVAQVSNDPRNDNHEILVKKGGGQVERNGETVNLSNYERVSFKADSPTMSKEKEVGPPILIDPGNMLPVFAQGTVAAVRFTWSSMDNSKSYKIRVAKNPYFSQLVTTKVVSTPEFTMAGLPEGAYYWSVVSMDDRGHESVESERNRFTVIPRSVGDNLPLELDTFTQHGHIIEVKGKTDPTARVMVNGGEVPIISPDGHFSYMTPPLPNGENVITVTAQNAKGGVNTQTKKVVIQ
jgi:hypothetical protein